jgi:hypothetical protein
VRRLFLRQISNRRVARFSFRPPAKVVLTCDLEGGLCDVLAPSARGGVEARRLTRRLPSVLTSNRRGRDPTGLCNPWGGGNPKGIRRGRPLELVVGGMPTSGPFHAITWAGQQTTGNPNTGTRRP